MRADRSRAADIIYLDFEKAVHIKEEYILLASAGKAQWNSQLGPDMGLAIEVKQQGDRQTLAEWEGGDK